jgi:putative sterol carrier protein
VSSRAVPPDDISPLEFFTRWVPDAVAEDAARRKKLGRREACIVFELDGAAYTLQLASDGHIRGRAGDEPDSDLRVRVDEETWRMLNRGDLSAPRALLERRIHLEGDLLLGLRLHLILGG